MNKKILIVDDDPDMRSALNLSLKKLKKEGSVFSSAEEALDYLKLSGINEGPGSFSLILSDLNLPGMNGLDFLGRVKEMDGFKHVPFSIITAYGSIETAISAMKLGAFDYLLKPFGIADFERIVRNAEKFSAVSDKTELSEKNTSGRAVIEMNDDRTSANSGFVYKSDIMHKIISYLNVIAPTDATVLITGESGTGKEVAARAIHELSGRKGRFVAVNCSAIVPTLLESELFGHEKGSFTGAISKKTGKLELADGGTILLDEIADMDKNLQSKILRTIQEKSVDRVGGNDPVKVDVRIIAATNKDIAAMAKEGDFREDLYYRLNVISIKMPPLRDRKTDISELAVHFMNKYSRKYFRNCREISKDSLNYLASLEFPGNVRELENIMERAVILAQNDEILNMSHFAVFDESPRDEEYDSRFTVKNGDVAAINPDNLNIKDMEELLIKKALDETGGSKAKAAEKLGITARTLRNKLKEYDLKEK